MGKSKGSGDRVVAIDDVARGVLQHYLSLFPNYREAGKAIGVGKDTIAKYATESAHLAYPVYLAMCREVESRCTKKAIQERFGVGKLEELSVGVRDKNSVPLEPVMYEITPGIRQLIQHFMQAFPNRSKAAKSLDLNPRTLKAYASGQIQSFPRTRFDLMVETLKAKGDDDAGLLRIAGAESWDSILRERSRSEVLDVEGDDLLERLVEHLVHGELDLKQINRPLYNACRRQFGSVGAAYEAAIDLLATELEKRGRDLLQEGKAIEAHDLVVRFEKALRSYATKAKLRSRAARKSQQGDWRSRVVDLVARKERVKSAIFKESQFHPSVNSQSEDEKLRFLHPYLRPFRTYSRESSFERGELVFHALFGMGRVVHIEARGQMRVRFAPKVGTKILAFQPKPYI